MDVPTPRMVKIGKATVGLVGLDTALARVAGDFSLSDPAAAEKVFEEIVCRNYVPGSARDAYLRAIENEVARLRGREVDPDGDLVIRILGPGCVSCNNLQKLVIEIMDDMGIGADVFQVHDLDEIGRFGVMQTPALVINGQVKSSGRLPARAKIEEWLREELLL